MTDATLEDLDGEGRRSPWDRVVEIVGPLTAGQRWTAGLAFAATALFLTAGMPSARTLTDDSVRGSLDSAAAPAVEGSLEESAPSQFSAGLDAGVTTDASTFFNDPLAGAGTDAGPTETFVDPLAGADSGDSTPTDDGATEDPGPTEPTGEAEPEKPPVTTPVPLPVPLPL